MRRPFTIAAAVTLAAVFGAGCATQQTSGTPTPTPTTTTAPTTSVYTPAEQGFLRAYPSFNPEGALTGGRTVCTSLASGIDRDQLVDMIVTSANHGAGVSEDDANLLIDAATAHLCPDQAAAAAKPAGPVSTIRRDGIYVVGKDIEPGVYESSGGEFCYWARLRGLGGQLGDIIANDNVQGRAVVEVKASDKAFQTKRCGVWRKR